MSAVGWFCPACQKHHAPHVETCPAPVDAIGTKTIPPVHYPNEPVVLYEEWMKRLKADPCAGCSGLCGNVACPKRMTITCDNTAPATLGWFSTDLARPS